MDASGGSQGGIYAAHQQSTEALMATVLGASPSLELSQQAYGDASLNSLALEQQWQCAAPDLQRGPPPGALAHPQQPQLAPPPQHSDLALGMHHAGGMGSASARYARDEALKAISAAHMQPARHYSPHTMFQVAQLSTAGPGGDLHHGAHDAALGGMDNGYANEASATMGGLLSQRTPRPAHPPHHRSPCRLHWHAHSAVLDTPSLQLASPAWVAWRVLGARVQAGTQATRHA